jgi:hypothetical protein
MGFVKSSQKKPPAGVRVSPHHLIACVSSGIPSLDTLVLGGGLPVGHWLSIVSDQPSVYTKLFPQFYLSEGAEMEQTLFVAGRNSVKNFTFHVNLLGCYFTHLRICVLYINTISRVRTGKISDQSKTVD